MFTANTPILSTVQTGGIVVSSIQNILLEELYLIQQTSTVDEFHRQFEATRTQVSSA